ncbi:MAG TPA: bifunctional 5,10-methylenetetrahydrofolate dehydrogenase/5,10-methenyltetrahydrofolate cyclohydrolase [Patescibacteria group bacterium]|nr:bifunctional 5,10-methylenetetrahydrofolate dehydrogenase/5,10-methenyltetrahydrofolate cyclohydrolase [Patescibacteria group bacterium]
MIINGRAIAKEILNELKTKVQNLKVTPTLAIILVGDNPQSVAYIEQKELKANKIGAKVIVKKLNDKVSESELLQIIQDLNKDNSIHGIIIQRPVPNISSGKLDLAVIPQKDVDGFNPASNFEPPIAKAIIKILKSVDSNFANKKIAVIGSGKTGGEPIIKTFQKMGMDLSVVDSKTENPELVTKSADVVISAVGKPNVLNTNNIKKGSIVLSVGLHKGEDEKLHGDYNEEEIDKVASFYTPTPGGVGPVNVAMLLENLVEAAQ